MTGSPGRPPRLSHSVRSDTSTLADIRLHLPVLYPPSLYLPRLYLCKVAFHTTFYQRGDCANPGWCQVIPIQEYTYPGYTYPGIYLPTLHLIQGYTCPCYTYPGGVYLPRLVIPIQGYTYRGYAYPGIYLPRLYLLRDMHSQVSYTYPG